MFYEAYLVVTHILPAKTWYYNMLKYIKTTVMECSSQYFFTLFLLKEEELLQHSDREEKVYF